MLSLRPRFDRTIKFFHLESWLRLFMLCVLVGSVSGLIGVLFDRGLYYLSLWVLHGYIFHMGTGQVLDLLMLLLIPCLGLTAAAAIAARWGPEARGGGTDAVIRAFHHQQGVIRPRVPWIKGICTVLTIGSGGSAGKEGPTAHIGAGVGSAIAARLGLSVRDRRILMLAGCAGGLGAVLRAPLGGALFSAEVLYRDPDFEHNAVMPGIISSVTAYSVFTALLGHAPLITFPIESGITTLHYPSEGGNRFGELLHYAVLSLCCALVAFLAVKGLRLIKTHVLGMRPVPIWAKPGVAGIMLGAMAAILLLTLGLEPYRVMGEGRLFLQEVVADAVSPGEGSGALTITVLLLVMGCRIIGTGLTVGSGASGGLLFPVILIGALTGAAYGKFWQQAPLPDWLSLTAEARGGLIMVAMAGLFCGCNKTPIASLVMVSELTGSYGLAVPLMLCCASTYLLTSSFTIDEEQVRGMADSPAHRGDFLVNVLEGIKVGDAITDRIKPELIPADLPFSKVLERIKHSTATSYAIVDAQNYLVGIFSLNDIRQIMDEQAVGHLVVAGDLGTTNVPTVTMETNLSDALIQFTQKNIDQLPVVEIEERHSQAINRSARRIERPRGTVGSKRVIAMLTRHDLISAYRRKLSELQSMDVQESAGSNVFDKGLASISPDVDLGLLEVSAPTLPPRDAAHVDMDMIDEPKDTGGAADQSPKPNNQEPKDETTST